MKRLFYALLFALALSGCVTVGNDMFGINSAEQARNNAKIEIARIQANAANHAADQETVRTALWAGAVPWALIIVGAVVLVGLYMMWAGRIRLRTMDLSAQALAITYQQPHQLPAASAPTLAQLQHMAERDGYRVIVRQNVAYLLDASGQPVGQRLLTGG